MSAVISILLNGLQSISTPRQEARFFRSLTRYVLPIIAVLLALQVTWLVAPFVSFLPAYLVFLAAIIVTAWYGGFPSAVFATGVSTIVIDFYFIPPLYSFHLISPDWGTLGFFAVEAIAIAYGINYLQTSRRHSLIRERQLQHLQELSGRLVQETTLDSMLEDVMKAAIELLEAEKGVIQLYDGQEHVLRLIKQIGFPEIFSARFERVPIGSYSCGTAFERKQRIIIANVAFDHEFSGMVPIFEEFGIAGAQSTPLFTPDGNVFGILSTYWSKPNRPSESQLHLLDLYAHQAERMLLAKQNEEGLHQTNEALERRMREKQGESTEREIKLRNLTSELVYAEERERHHLSTELHDSLAQLLMLARIKVRLAQDSTSVEAAKRYLRETDQVLQRSANYTRTLMAELHPPDFEALGLPNALHWLAEQMREHALYVDVHVDSESLPLSHDRAVVSYQCVRELLMNVVKHAKVDKAMVSLTRKSDNLLQIVVQDEGRGFDQLLIPDIPGKHFGLHSIGERLARIGGRVQIESAAGRGCRVTLTMPLQDQPVFDEVRVAIPSAPDRLRVKTARDPNQEILPLGLS